MMTEIDILVEDWPAANWHALAKDVTGALFAHAEIAPIVTQADEIEIAIRLSSDDEVRQLNARWREKDAPTNVLSFPMDDIAAQTLPGQAVMLGDIILAQGVCSREAAKRGITLADHASHLIVHGVLHLLGFDHIDDTQAERMESIERDVMKGLGLHDPYMDG
jgi:probable rRNA maturation factor